MHVQADTCHVLVMEHLTSARFRLGTDQACFEMAVKAFVTLYYSSLVHGDVKPELILESYDGRCDPG